MKKKKKMKENRSKICFNYKDHVKVNTWSENRCVYVHINKYHKNGEKKSLSFTAEAFKKLMDKRELILEYIQEKDDENLIEQEMIRIEQSQDMKVKQGTSAQSIQTPMSIQSASMQGVSMQSPGAMQAVSMYAPVPMKPVSMQPPGAMKPVPTHAPVYMQAGRGREQYQLLATLRAQERERERERGNELHVKQITLP
ncbi:uncharacterized protein LOC121375078 [Gigantopelta aegis]|uniref:uncharacterized protein LOC121375078 n=1 Tax=Gigantopelta aegis TaxID=1735272 RepID=UPI001B88877B|nr:uncharacterized protein LOC121375078 [Gigantopelta aegis]